MTKPTTFIWASRFAGKRLCAPLVRSVCRSRRAIRSITFAHFMRFGGSAAIPLAKTVVKKLWFLTRQNFIY
jgi:hypothetical protein